MSKRLSQGDYQLFVADGEFVARWQPRVFAPVRGDHGTYMYGRDYAEMIKFWDAKDLKSWSILDPRASEFNRLLSSRLAGQRLHSALRHNPAVEKVLCGDNGLRAYSSSSTDNFLAKIQQDHPEIFRDLSAISDTLDVLKSYFVSAGEGKFITSFDALEGTPFLLGLVHAINSSPRNQWIVFGPERYAHQFQLTFRPRPYIDAHSILELFNDVSGTSKVNAANLFENWSTARLDGKDGGRLTLAEANSFMKFAVSGGSPDETISQIVPPQVAAPLNVLVRNDRIARVDIQAIFLPDEGAISASCDHIDNLIGDISEAGYLSNWAPGARRKLERLRDHARTLKQPVTRTVSAITQLGLDTEALRQVFERTKEELADSVINEFGPLFLHVNLLLGQFPVWQEFLDNAERLNWGKNASLEYTGALRSVYQALIEAPDAAVDQTVKSYAEGVLTQPDEPVDVVGFASSARNIFSATTRFLLSLRDRLISSTSDAVADGLTGLAKSTLQAVFSRLGAAILVLVRENPTYFYWLEHAAKLLGWVK